mmetsp:Transcript_91706/g.273644  ORF Transcript_91706/g.273644 Transcript_91706/m.273644 type:complete len:208 (-) Transcript_91706:884-1507(-)
MGAPRGPADLSPDEVPLRGVARDDGDVRRAHPPGARHLQEAHERRDQELGLAAVAGARAGGLLAAAPTGQVDEDDAAGASCWPAEARDGGALGVGDAGGDPAAVEEARREVRDGAVHAALHLELQEAPAGVHGARAEQPLEEALAEAAGSRDPGTHGGGQLPVVADAREGGRTAQKRHQRRGLGSLRGLVQKHALEEAAAEEARIPR